MTKELDEDAGHEIRSQVGGWAMVPNWVLTIGLTPGELAIYVAMRSFANRNGECYPTAKKIAARACGASVRSVHNAFGKFRKLGLITTTDRERPDKSLAGLNIVMIDLPPVQTPTPHSAGGAHSPVQTPSPDSAGKNTPTNHPTEPPVVGDADASPTTPGAEIDLRDSQPPVRQRRAKGEVAEEARITTEKWLEWAGKEGLPVTQDFPAVMGIVNTCLRNWIPRDSIASALASLTQEGQVVTSQSMARALRQLRPANGAAGMFTKPKDQTWYEQSHARAAAREAAGGGGDR